jgi:hypothetical protein
MMRIVHHPMFYNVLTTMVRTEHDRSVVDCIAAAALRSAALQRSAAP